MSIMYYLCMHIFNYLLSVMENTAVRWRHVNCNYIISVTSIIECCLERYDIDLLSAMSHVHVFTRDVGLVLQSAVEDFSLVLS